MKKRKEIILLFLLISVFVAFIFSCKKENKDPEGAISLEVEIVHHDRPVIGLPVYLKANSSEFPGRDSTQYDYKQVTDQNGKVNFTKLAPGIDYLYAYGFDNVAGENVIGYTPVNLNSVSVQNNKANIVLYVSE